MLCSFSIMQHVTSAENRNASSSSEIVFIINIRLHFVNKYPLCFTELHRKMLVGFSHLLPHFYSISPILPKFSDIVVTFFTKFLQLLEVSGKHLFPSCAVSTILADILFPLTWTVLFLYSCVCEGVFPTPGQCGGGFRDASAFPSNKAKGLPHLTCGRPLA